MTPFQTRYYDFWTRLVNSKNHVRAYEIDFDKPFWHYLLNVKAHIFVCILDLVFIYIFNPIFVIFITKAIIERDLNQFIFWGIAKIFQHFVVLALGRSFVYLYDITETSFRKNVQTKLLQLDPINFTTKSSGEIVAKFERTVAAIHSFNSSLFELIIPFIFSIIVAVVVVSQINLVFGIMFTIFFALLCGANVWLVRNNNDIFLTKINKLEEQEKQLLLENITQNHYIRSTFATPEQLDKTNETIFKVAFDNATKWRTWQWITIFLEVILMLILIGFIGYTLFTSNTEIYLVLALFTSLFGFYEKFYELGLTTDDFFKSIHNQQEFWQFMRTFGKQSFPVIEETKNIDKTKLI